ncbi:GNAT family N-acetyltransferase [Bacillus timonensis]|uniref:GNAT family N-acetyltransferase n=1 Tax=Bacillus timonensis TaxID=1033734 RepID=UPI000288ED55|nr:GNAT family N-acetyltransferase [Bacillus timonensis]
MLEFRLVEEDEFQQAIDLADKVFRKKGHVSMGIAFPQVFSAALNQSYGAFVDDKLVSFIGLVPSILHLEDAEVQAFSIGAVCTDPDYRKKGFANKLLEKVFDHVNNSDASVLFISGDLPLYLKQGCTFYGKMNQYKIHRGDITADTSLNVRELGSYDWFQLRKLSHDRNIRYEQTIFEIAQLTKAAGYASIFKMKHKVLVAEKNHEVTAFLLFGVPYEEQEGVDSHVIEWGGDPLAITTLLSEAFTYGLDSLTWNVPSYEKELIQALDLLQEKVEKTYPGTIKIMNLDRLLNQLNPYFKDKLDISTVDENQKRLLGKEISVFMSNSQVEELILKGSKNVDSYFGDVFPIPFPFPQGLNYV